MKFLKIVLVLGMVVPLQAMQRFLTNARFAAAAYKNQFHPKMRHLQDLAQIKGAYLLGPKTPLIGHLTDIEIKNDYGPRYRSMLAEGLRSDNEDKNVTHFLQSLFYQNPVDQTISVTQQDKSMVRALPPSGIAYLLDTYSSGLNKTNDDAFFEKWYQKYTTIEGQIHQPFSKNSFIKKARQFLKNFRTMAQAVKPEQVSSILLSVLFKNAHDKKDLQAFATAYGVILPEESYGESDFLAFEEKFQAKGFHALSCEEYEQFSYWLLEKQQRTQGAAYKTQLLKASSVHCGYKGQRVRALCVEETIGTFFNTLLYNPETEGLDTSLLPKKVQLSCVPELLAVVEKHKTLKINSAHEKERAQDFLDLFSDKPGISYYGGKNYELDSSLDNTLKLLKYLFGLPMVKSYKELGDLLSTDTRTIIFTEDVANRKATFGIYKKDDTKPRVELVLRFDLGHSSSTFSRDDEFSYSARSTINNTIQSISNGLLSFSPWAFTAHDFNAMSPAVFQELIIQKDFLIDSFFIKKMISLLGGNDKPDKEALVKVLVDNWDTLNRSLLSSVETRNFFLTSLEEVSDPILSLQIAQKLVATGYRFSANDISYSIIAKNSHQALPFCLEHAKADISYINHVGTALSYNAPECLKILIERGFMPHKAPIFYNVLKRHASESFIKVLLDSEPSLLQSRDPDGIHSPLFYALANRADEKVFKALIEAGADLYEVNQEGKTALSLIRKRFGHDESFLNYLRPLAIYSVDFTTMPEDRFKQLLQEKDFVINEGFIEDLSAAIPSYISGYSDNQKAFKLFEIFIHHCAEVPPAVFSLDFFKIFFLDRHKSIEYVLGDIEDQNKVLCIAQKLVQAGFTFSEHCVVIATIQGRHLLLPFLLRHRDQSNSFDMSHCLKYALSRCNSDCLKVFIEQGCATDMTGVLYQGLQGDGISPACLKLLIEKEPTLLRIKDPQTGKTPLMYELSQKKRQSVLEALIDAAADVTE